MKKLQVFSPNAEVRGRAVNGLVTSILHEQFEPVLRRHGLSQVDPHTWYPQHRILNVMKDIANNVTDPLVMVSIGTKMIENTLMAPFHHIEEVVHALAYIHAVNHRNLAGQEGITVRQAGHHHLEVINATPYPDDFMYGYFFGVVACFRPTNSRPVITYRTPNSSNSDHNMVYDIIW